MLASLWTGGLHAFFSIGLGHDPSPCMAGLGSSHTPPTPPPSVLGRDPFPPPSKVEAGPCPLSPMDWAIPSSPDEADQSWAMGSSLHGAKLGLAQALFHCVAGSGPGCPIFSSAQPDGALLDLAHGGIGHCPSDLSAKKVEYC